MPETRTLTEVAPTAALFNREAMFHHHKRECELRLRTSNDGNLFWTLDNLSRAIYDFSLCLASVTSRAQVGELMGFCAKELKHVNLAAHHRNWLKATHQVLSALEFTAEEGHDLYSERVVLILDFLRAYYTQVLHVAEFGTALEQIGGYEDADVAALFEQLRYVIKDGPTALPPDDQELPAPPKEPTTRGMQQTIYSRLIGGNSSAYLGTEFPEGTLFRVQEFSDPSRAVKVTAYKTPGEAINSADAYFLQYKVSVNVIADYP